MSNAVAIGAFEASRQLGFPALQHVFRTWPPRAAADKRRTAGGRWVIDSMISLPYIICSVLSFVPAIVFHEVAHGFAASKLGDPTAKNRGRLSLNPLKHVDPFGTVLMPLLLLSLGGPVFGYAKPVPYNPMYFKDRRKGEAIVGLAGPSPISSLPWLERRAWLLYPAAPTCCGKPGVLYFYALFLLIFPW
ncbi:MAG: hypothetical protein ACLTQI_01585 [Slackia sp.]